MFIQTIDIFILQFPNVFRLNNNLNILTLAPLRMVRVVPLKDVVIELGVIILTEPKVLTSR